MQRPSGTLDYDRRRRTNTNNDLCVRRIRNADRQTGSAQYNENPLFQFHNWSGNLLLFFEIEFATSERLIFASRAVLRY
jgi:hypothetical protein